MDQTVSKLSARAIVGLMECTIGREELTQRLCRHPEVLRRIWPALRGRSIWEGPDVRD